MITVIRRRLSTTLTCLSWLLWLTSVVCFRLQPDHFAAFTVLPFWLWGGSGLLLSGMAMRIDRSRITAATAIIWILTLLLGCDEIGPLTRFGQPTPEPGPAPLYQNQPVLRVATLNCAIFKYGNPTLDLAAWQPDIVLLQDVMPYQTEQICKSLYGNHGSMCTRDTNGIITRYKIVRESPSPTLRNQQATIEFPDGRKIELVNVHLATAATDLRFWNRSTWTDHRVNRVLRRDELSLILTNLHLTTSFPITPTLFGGDFNAPATDIVYHTLADNLVDSFAAVGTGWGNTYHRRLPILRIDHLYATRHFTPVRAKTITTRHSDHRMIVVDYTLNPPP